MKKIIITISLVLMLPLCANEASIYPEKFMKGIISEKYDKTVDDYFLTNPTISSKKQQILMVKSQVKNIFNIFGKAIDYELALDETLTPSLKRFVYILKHTNHATVWEFFIYKPKDKWIVSNMTFKDDFNMLKKYK